MQHLPLITPLETGPSPKTSTSKSESSTKTTNVQIFTSKAYSLTFLRKWNKGIKNLPFSNSMLQLQLLHR